MSASCSITYQLLFFLYQLLHISVRTAVTSVRNMFISYPQSFIASQQIDLTIYYKIIINMKITAQLIQQSPQFTNPLNERQLDLRGYKITQIENMGATLNFFECIDLSDNEIRKLGNFSYLDKLTSLILTNNRIKSIGEVSEFLPEIENIFLMNNKISELEEVYKLGKCQKLHRLVLVNNLVTEAQDYRLNVIARIPTLRILDFEKVTQTERGKAQELQKQQQKK